MSKSSRRRQAWRKKQSQNNGEQVASQTEPILKVWPQASWGDADSLDDDLDDSLFEPITAGPQSQAVSEPKAQPESKPQAQSESQKGNAVPKTRQQPDYVVQPQQQAQMPEWAESFMKQLAKQVAKNHDDIEEDHQLLIEQGCRLDDVEADIKDIKVAVWGAKPIEATDLDLAKTQPILATDPEPEPEPEAAVDPKLEPAPPTVLAPESQPQPEPQAQSETGFPEYIIPKEMYEAKSFEGGKWRLRGPYKRISQAEQAAKGDLSKVKIVQVWYNTHNDRVVRQLTAEEMEKYC